MSIFLLSFLRSSKMSMIVYVIVAMSVFFFGMSLWYARDVNIALNEGDVEAASRLDAEWAAGMVLYLSLYIGGVLLYLFELMGL